MGTKRRSFERPSGYRRYRRLFVIAVEGERTENDYFNFFNDSETLVKVECSPGKRGTSPPQVLDRLNLRLAKYGYGLMEDDEAWVVVDRDYWTDDQLQVVHSWATSEPRRGLALSNPKFEYWLLLHFEDGCDIKSVRDCDDHLRRHLPTYDKRFDVRKITHESVRDAVKRAKQRDKPACVDWPRNLGCTTVYRLVDRILKARDEENPA